MEDDSPQTQSQRHRGAHPEDARLFGDSQLERLRSAAQDLSWLLTRGYSPASALKLVGDRYQLEDRQRVAVARGACSDPERERRLHTNVSSGEIAVQEVDVDGFNQLITVEAALGGGVLLRCRDGTLRDMSSVHGTYRSVEETDQALRILGGVLSDLGPSQVTWWLDRPVSNSGRLAARIMEAAEEREWPWSVELVADPDSVLARSSRIVLSSDSSILDRAAKWCTLADGVLARIPAAWVVDLSDDLRD